MSIIFNVFVIYTLFNQINCRMIDDSYNIFKRIGRSLLFPLITLIELALQVLIVCFGRSIFHVANNGLTGQQWGICFGFSAITFVVSIIGKFLPIHVLIDKCLYDKEEEEKKKKKDVINFQQKEEKSSSSTEEGSEDIRLHTKKKYMIKLFQLRKEEAKKIKML